MRREEKWIRRNALYLLTLLCVCTLYSGSVHAKQEELKVGDTLTLGSWEQGKKESDRTDITWKVLDITKEQLLIISEQVLEVMPFSKDPKCEHWEDSDVRQWLNEVFYQRAFDEKERDRIYKVQLENAANSHFDTGAGEDTQDYVFLLSEEEITQYMPHKNEREAEATEYAKKQNIYVSEVNEMSFWWLRTSGQEAEEDEEADKKDRPDQSAMCVGAEGTLVLSGYPVLRPDFGVRPAMWIKK